MILIKLISVESCLYVLKKNILEDLPFLRVFLKNKSFFSKKKNCRFGFNFSLFNNRRSSVGEFIEYDQSKIVLILMVSFFVFFNLSTLIFLY